MGGRTATGLLHAFSVRMLPLVQGFPSPCEEAYAQRANHDHHRQCIPDPEDHARGEQHERQLSAVLARFPEPVPRQHLKDIHDSPGNSGRERRVQINAL